MKLEFSDRAYTLVLLGAVSNWFAAVWSPKTAPCSRGSTALQVSVQVWQSVDNCFLRARTLEWQDDEAGTVHK